MNEKVSALNIILAELRKANIEHSVGGSGLLYFLGLVDNVGDWDILTSASSAEIEKVFEKYNPKRLGVSETYYSDFLYQIFIDDVKVEVIGHFRYKSNNEVVEVSSKPYLKVKDIPISSPNDWIKFYQMMRKTKNVSLLENWLNR